MFLVQVSERKDAFEAIRVWISWGGVLEEGSISEVKIKSLLSIGHWFLFQGTLAFKDDHK